LPLLLWNRLRKRKNLDPLGAICEIGKGEITAKKKRKGEGHILRERGKLSSPNRRGKEEPSFYGGERGGKILPLKDFKTAT